MYTRPEDRSFEIQEWTRELVLNAEMPEVKHNGGAMVSALDLQVGELGSLWAHKAISK